ncbi:Phenylalanine--tRNA ligase beta subunit [Grifola frondosa]|uniref:phenylalanine--tRNA ligase n=1 Tax=Grifola frondosa TaxID=5627 RepID=A0A1C7MNV7_GRIFR|nr:Phenylalanine--tRNA ligase beta subunit [Grifola frondosa]
MADWLSKEEGFQLEQERTRAIIRLKEKRAKAVDFLALNLRYVNPIEEEDKELDADGLEIDLDEPYNIIDSLTPEQVEELHNDIERYLSLELSEVNIEFWTNMMVICKDQLDRIKATQRMGAEAAAAVEADITALLQGKSYDHLVALQKQVQAKLSSGEPIDVDYWEGLLKKLLVWKAKAKLKSLHEVVVRNRLEQLRKRQRDEALQAQEELLAGVAKSASAGEHRNIIPVVGSSEQEAAEEVEPYDRSMSPELLDIRKLHHEDRQVDIVTTLEDLRYLMQQRRAVAGSRFVPKSTEAPVEVQDIEAPSGADLASEALYRAEAERELDEEEELFNIEENIVNPTTYNWEDKYRPRKPRYFNRVHTGYEWNKYNQTHYDTDNPPPKVVQGYKFNIFYPDLIDKSKAPTYKIVKEPGNDETVLLHFTAGPPYEDIAFRIVNREWEFSHKRGFRSSFDRGCLSLWFNFRRNLASGSSPPALCIAQMYCTIRIDNSASQYLWGSIKRREVFSADYAQVQHHLSALHCSYIISHHFITPLSTDLVIPQGSEMLVPQSGFACLDDGRHANAITIETIYLCRVAHSQHMNYYMCLQAQPDAVESIIQRDYPSHLAQTEQKHRDADFCFRAGCLVALASQVAAICPGYNYGIIDDGSEPGTGGFGYAVVDDSCNQVYSLVTTNPCDEPLFSCSPPPITITALHLDGLNYACRGDPNSGSCNGAPVQVCTSSTTLWLLIAASSLFFHCIVPHKQARMPTVAVDKEDLWRRLGREYSSEAFDQLLFDFGLELDEDTTEEVEAARKKGLPTERPQLKIEVPANRYDLLCIEGISRGLRAFLGLDKPPQYKLVYPKGGENALLTITVSPETQKIRPYFAAAILRNIKFTQRSYESFIDLQDKLHQNICRRRQFVAIGTHDLDTIQPPFRYEARPPKNIKFVPLSKQKEYTAEELMTVYESEKHLARYLPIIRDSPVFPVIYDVNDTVLSMPPIINSEHSKITLNTRNVFIDVTATDETKLGIVVNIISTMFSEYCKEPLTIEPCRIVYPDGTTHITPDLSYRPTIARASYVNSCTGLSLDATEVSKLLERMTLTASVSPNNPDEVAVMVPPTRPDILHECDIMEDTAIAYGFNNLPDTFPSTSTVAQPLALSKLSDIVRTEWALAGWVEVLPLILCSHEENFGWLNRSDDGTQAVRIANPKTLEFQVVRTSLIPGLLKTIRENRSHALPIRVFETSDVVVKDAALERQARNVRHAAAVWCNKTAGFEVVHGILDRIMQMLEVPRIAGTDFKAETGYYIKERHDPTFFPGRAATIYYRPPPTENNTISEITRDIKAALHKPGDKEIGMLGILHPTVLEKFEITYPCSALEFTLEPFKKELQTVWTNAN